MTVETLRQHKQNAIFLTHLWNSYAALCRRRRKHAPNKEVFEIIEERMVWGVKRLDKNVFPVFIPIAIEKTDRQFEQKMFFFCIFVLFDLHFLAFSKLWNLALKKKKSKDRFARLPMIILASLQNSKKKNAKFYVFILFIIFFFIYTYKSTFLLQICIQI